MHDCLVLLQWVWALVERWSALKTIPSQPRACSLPPANLHEPSAMQTAPTVPLPTLWHFAVACASAGWKVGPPGVGCRVDSVTRGCTDGPETKGCMSLGDGVRGGGALWFGFGDQCFGVV